MLYFVTGEGMRILVLGQDHIDYLKKGELIVSPDSKVAVLYTPDEQWLGEKLIENMDKLTPSLFNELITEAKKRPVQHAGAYYPTVQIIKEGKPVKRGD
jgi:hypothetical protein